MNNKPMESAIPYKEYFLNNRVYEPFDDALAQCKEEDDIDGAKQIVRIRRNKLLELSDSRMSIDRLGLTAPSYTLTGIIEFIRTLVRALTGEWAVYRQALRDITKQPGFPYDITWPKEPEDS